MSEKLDSVFVAIHRGQSGLNPQTWHCHGIISALCTSTKIIVTLITIDRRAFEATVYSDSSGTIFGGSTIMLVIEKPYILAKMIGRIISWKTILEHSSFAASFGELYPSVELSALLFSKMP